MTSEASRERADGKFLGLLRIVALIAAVVGAAGSLGLMLYVGRRNPSRLLLFFFTVWDLAPFVALLWANMVSKRWAVLTRATLYGVTFIIAFGSLAIYEGVALQPEGAPRAFNFLVVPIGSWVLMAVGALLARTISRE